MPQTKRYFEESEDLISGVSPDRPEFEALIRSKIGGRFKESVTPEKIGLAALIGDPTAKWSLRGFNSYEGIPTAQEIKDYAGPILEGKEPPAGKRIFGVGAGASPRTWAHEFRHDIERNEYNNRMLDVMYGSTSLPAYKANIEKVYEHLTRSDPENRKKSFEERYKIHYAPLEEKEKYVLNELKNSYASRREINEEMGTFSQIFNKDYIDKNFELNRSGAVGGTKGNKTLPKDILEFRSKFPFLNFIGRLEEPSSKKKATGGAIENTTHDRKLI